MNRPFFGQLVCCLTSFLFLYTGASKFLSLHEFANTLKHAPLLAGAAGQAAIAIPLTELLLALGLLVPKLQKLALYASVALLGVFSVYIGWLLLSGAHLPCTCGGVISGMGWKAHLVFNLSFIALDILGIKLCMHQNRGSRKPAEQSRHHFLF